MAKIVFLRGDKRTGKTDWAIKEMLKYPDQYKRVCLDEIREMVDLGFKTTDCGTALMEIEDNMITGMLLMGYDVIVDDTNLYPEDLARMDDTKQKLEALTRVASDNPLLIAIEIIDFK